MLTATIKDTTWVNASAVVRESHLKARLCSVPRPQGAFLAAELTLLAAILLLARNASGLGAAIVLASCALFFHLKGIDKSILNSKPSYLLIDILESLSLGLLVSALLFYVFPHLTPRLEESVRAATLICLLPAVLRPVLRHLVAAKKLVEDVLIVGTGELAARLYRIVAHARVNSVPTVTDVGVSVDFLQLNEMIAHTGVSRVIVAERDAQSRNKVASALLDSRLRGLHVDDAVDFYESFSGKIWVDALDSEWFVYTDGFTHSRLNAFLKRAFDIAFALTLILLTAPVMAIIAIAIKVGSRGPALFRQTRVGLHGAPFTIYKFRSMRQDAEVESGPAWATEGDGRVTVVGRVLRKFRLDEIPQAFNVLRGEMSIVGPRPERPYFVERLEQQIPFYSLRHYVKPGITGWAQVMYPYGATTEDAYEKLQYDLYYAKHKSMKCDADILLRTLNIVLLGRGR